MRMAFAVPTWSASARSAGAKPWSRSTTGSRAKERSRSSRIVARCRSSAVPSTALASSSLPICTAWSAASSISAIPERFCTGPSCRNSAIRLRSSCSAEISLSRASSGPDDARSVNDRFAQGDRDCVRPRVGLELREDVPHVALDRLLRDEEPLRDVGVGHAVREELEDLPLPRRQHVGLVLAGEERRHKRRVDVALALSDLLDRADERLVRRLLEDVALGTAFEAAAEQRALGVRGEDEHLRLGNPLRQEL